MAEEMKFCKCCDQPIYPKEMTDLIKAARKRRRIKNREAKRRWRQRKKEMKKNEFK